LFCRREQGACAPCGVGFEGLGLRAQPSRIARLPSARRTASRAVGARCKAERHEQETASPLRRSSDSPDRRKPGPAITHLLSARRTAPRAAGARCKAERHEQEAAPPARRRLAPRNRHQPAPRRIPHRPKDRLAAHRPTNTDINNPSTIRTPIQSIPIQLSPQHRIFLPCTSIHNKNEEIP